MTYLSVCTQVCTYMMQKYIHIDACMHVYMVCMYVHTNMSRTAELFAPSLLISCIVNNYHAPYSGRQKPPKTWIPSWNENVNGM